MIRILIVDDQNLVQQGIKSLLDRDLDFKVIGTVKDGRNAVEQIAQIDPDIVLLDIEMPGMDGITATKYINQIAPRTKVIILSSHEEKKYVTQALMAGAKGYILKDSLMTDLKQAIIAAYNGYSQIDSKLLAKVFDPQSLKAKKNGVSQESKPIVKKNVIKKNVTKKNVNKDQKQDLPEHQISNQEIKEVVTVNQEQSEKTTNSAAVKNSTLPIQSPEKVNTKESSIPESDTQIQSEEPQSAPEEHQPISKEKTTFPKKQTVMSHNISDGVVLKQTKPEKKQANYSHFYPKMPPAIGSNGSNAAISSVELESHSPELKRKSNKSGKKLKQKASGIIPQLKQLANHPKILAQKPKIDELKSKIEPYRTKLLSWLRERQKQPLLWNIYLVALGMLVVLILDKI